MQEHERTTGQGQEHAEHAEHALTEAQVAELRERFTAAVAQLRPYRGLARSRATQDADRADCEAVFWARAWESFLAMARRGARPEDGLKSIGYFAALSGLSQRLFTDQSPRTDPLSPRAVFRGGPVKHSWHSVENPPSGRAAQRSGSDSLTRLLASAEEDRRGSNPLDRVMVREAIERILDQHCGTVRAIVLHLAEGLRTKEVARTIGTSQARVSQVRRLMRDEFAQLWRE